ncbi:universal stress protein UspA [Halobacteriales archaeon QS_8_69_26]|nr:MAG: universal stress protein UspA [Halobacteriales archaeon QS_8_69_26]
MAEHVLVGYDGSPRSEAALDHAIDEHADARITVLSVVNPLAAGYGADVTLPSGAEQWFRNAKNEAESLLAEAEERAAEAGVDVETTVGVGRPTRAIVEYAREHDVDHIVLGSHGRTGVSRIILGSVAESVMRKSPVPVTVVR